jgi:hypothetical protein
MTISHFKILKWTKLLDRIEIINEKIKRERESTGTVDLKILFRLSGAPQLLIELNKNRITATPVSRADANIVVTSDLSTLAHIKGKEKRLRAIIWALLTRKLKINGGLFSLIRFYRNLWLIEEIFSEKIS